MELTQVIQQLLGVYDDISEELGSVLAFLFIVLFVIIAVVILSMFINGRSNARMRAAQSDTLRTINDLVRTQSDREEKATEEAKRLNDLLLKQSMDYSQKFADQAQRLTTIEVKVPIYENEISDLKTTRDTLMNVLKEERDEWRKRERSMEERHIAEMTEIKAKFERTQAISLESQTKLLAVEARLEERETENIRRQKEMERVNTAINEIGLLKNSIDDLAKVIIDEFSKLPNFATVVPVVADGSGAGVSGDVSGRGNNIRNRYADRKRDSQSAERERSGGDRGHTDE